MEDSTVNNRNRVVVGLFASAGVVALSALSLSANAGPYGGRPVDQVRPSVSTTPEAHTSRVLPSPYAYVGRRIDHPQAVVETRGLEQAELAAFEEGRPSPPRRELPYVGRRVDALPFLDRE